MLWKRITHAFLLGAGISMVGAGCSAVNALVSSPAGHGANDSSPQRLVAIGRVFENQGQMNRATAMYRQAMKVDPGNTIAQERLQFIAGMNSGKSFSPSERRSQQAIAMADSIQNKTKTNANRQSATSQSKLKSALANDAVVASLQPTTSKVTQAVDAASSLASRSVQQVAGTVQSQDDEMISAFADDAGWVNVVETGWELAELQDTVSEGLSIQPAATATANFQAADIEIVALNGTDSSDAGHVSVATEWKATKRSPVLLDEVAACMENPAGNVELLLKALSNGEDEGVKALAATLLVECPADDSTINSALHNASTETSQLLQLAVGDALIQRGAITDEGIDGLLSLLVSANPEIRIQAAASLRNCAHTQWGLRCVDGLSRLLTQDDAQVVMVAASTLGDFGELAAAHVDTLQQLAASEDQLVAQSAVNALSRIQLHAPVHQGGLNPVDITTGGF